MRDVSTKLDEMHQCYSRVAIKKQQNIFFKLQPNDFHIQSKGNKEWNRKEEGKEKEREKRKQQRNKNEADAKWEKKKGCRKCKGHRKGEQE